MPSENRANHIRFMLINSDRNIENDTWQQIIQDQINDFNDEELVEITRKCLMNIGFRLAGINPRTGGSLEIALAGMQEAISLIDQSLRGNNGSD